jgi:uncharacterized damage-inducible protein DinB
MRTLTALLLLLVASPALAQSSGSTDARDLWHQYSGFVARSAADMPAEKFGYKPVSTVRSFGELVGHVAGAQAMFCAMALGEKPPAEDAVKATTKAELVAALTDSNTRCERAYAQSDAELGGMVDAFGQQRSRRFVLMLNAIHDGEHYGNLVTYLRMNDMVPPSSQPAR